MTPALRQNIGERPESPFTCDAQRTVPAGGALAGLLLHDSITPFQWILRILPDRGFFTASRDNVTTVNIGAATVPARMALAMGEYRFRIFRFDGLNPGDAVPLEDRRLSLEIGNYVSIASFVQKGNIMAQIIPATPPPNQQNFTGAFAGVVTGGTIMGNGQPPQGGPLRTLGQPGPVSNLYSTTGATNVTSSVPALSFPPVNTRQFVNTTKGAALIPNSNDPQQGPERLPFTYYATEGQSVSLELSVFAAVRTPVAFIEATIAGYLIPLESLRAFLEKVRPCDGR